MHGDVLLRDDMPFLWRWAAHVNIIRRLAQEGITHGRKKDKKASGFFVRKGLGGNNGERRKGIKYGAPQEIVLENTILENIQFYADRQYSLCLYQRHQAIFRGRLWD